jgi:3-oxoacyl-[acyl-carrier protein] reductase
MLVDLSGKIALVTGGSKGIGAASIRLLARSGAKVVLHYSSGQAEAERLAADIGSDSCALVRADLRRRGAAAELWRASVEAFGRIDLLVCNAALVAPLMLDAADEQWDRVWADTMQVNVRAIADLYRAALPHFLIGGGSIIAVASRAAFRGDETHLMHYAASKGALVALTRSIAKNFAADGITAYIVAPGFVRTERQEAVIATRGEADMLRDVPLGEMCTPDAVANVIAFLASGLARHATGATIDINGASYFH